MKAGRIIGIALIIIGIAMVATGGFSFRNKKKILDTDKVDITTTETKNITWPWFAGGIAVIGGIVVLLLADRKPRKV